MIITHHPILTPFFMYFSHITSIYCQFPFHLLHIYYVIIKLSSLVFLLVKAFQDVTKSTFTQGLTEELYG